MSWDRDLDEAVAEARRNYAERRPESARLAAVASEYLPGGNTRSVLDFEPFPFRVTSAEGAVLTDVDGHTYVDLLGNYTAGLLGHRPAAVRKAVVGALDAGLSIGATHPAEIELARLVCERFKSIDQVRFTNSGTEANLYALATAIHCTGRRGVLVFHAGYHGGVLYFGPTGRPINVPHQWVFADYNDIESVRLAFEAHPGEIASVLVEPMIGASGCIPGEPEFLGQLRNHCDSHGSLLIFDEVMTSRLSPGGAQELLGITPDMTTLGKYLAGGLTIGAFGGRRDLMAAFDPASGGALTQGGTFNNNTLTMAAGVAAMTDVLSPALMVEVNERGEKLRHRLSELFHESGLPLSITGWGSMMNIHAVPEPVRTPADLADADERLKELLFFELLEAGFYMARRGFIALTSEITDDHLESAYQVIEGWLESLRSR